MATPPAAGSTLLGFDFGRRRIGVAVGETVSGNARALCTLPARDGKPDWERVRNLLAEWHPAALVVGVPRNADGSAHAVTLEAERFARQLGGRFGLPVHRVDERLSSREAETRLAGHGRVHKPADIDKLAAQIILQDWLNSHGNPHDERP